MYMIDLLCHDISGSSASWVNPKSIKYKACASSTIKKNIYTHHYNTIHVYGTVYSIIWYPCDVFRIFQDKQKKNHIEMYG